MKNFHEMMPAGPFQAWLEMTRKAIQNGSDVKVPCGDCSACCRSGFFIAVSKGETQTLDRIPVDFLHDIPGIPEVLYIGFNDEGHCLLLKDGHCSIYENRPHSCRTFDCRVYNATGIQLDKDPSSPISKRVQEWGFTYPTEQDRARQEHLIQVSSILREHIPETPNDPSSENRRLLALKAILIASRLLDQNRIDTKR